MTLQSFYSYIQKNFQNPDALYEICAIYEKEIKNTPLLDSLEQAIKHIPHRLYGKFPFYGEFRCVDFFEILNSAAKAALNRDAFYLAVYIALCIGAKQRLCGMGVAESVAEQTLSGIALWAKKHKRISGSYGLPDYRWCTRYLCGAVLRFGSLEFEPCLNRDVRLPQKSDDGLKINVHIPEGTDFSYEARKASYLDAYDFYSKVFSKTNLVFVCESWLLSLDHEALGQCNINSFRRDFNIYNYYYDAEKDFLWRIFGNADINDPYNLPQSNRLMRLYRQKLLNGEKFCSGTGYFVISNRKIL